MKRRQVLASALATGTVATAGCLSVVPGFGGPSAPPPRRSEVFDRVAAADGALVIDIEDTPMVESRVEAADAVGSLERALPVGRARAGGRGGRGGRAGRGATGRGRGGAADAPRGSHGRAKYHGGDYDDWREEHADEVRKYDARVVAVGLAFLGSDAAYSEDPPPPGPVPWDRTWDDPSKEVLRYPDLAQGWYRVGGHLRSADGAHDFGWEAVDARVDDEGSAYEIETRWKVSPRL